MRPGVLQPGYRHIPLTLAHRRKLSDAHRERLGIPDGHVRIYGIFVPFSQAIPLREYAAEVARREGYAAAQEFVRSSLGRMPKRPYPAREVFYGPRLPPREFARLRLLHRAVRFFHIFVRRLSGTYKERGPAGSNARYDWALIVELLNEGATLNDVLEFTGANESYLKTQLRKRGLKRSGIRRHRRDR